MKKPSETVSASDSITMHRCDHPSTLNVPATPLDTSRSHARRKASAFATSAKNALSFALRAFLVTEETDA